MIRSFLILAAAGVLVVASACNNTAQQEPAETAAGKTAATGLIPATAAEVLAAVEEPGAKAVLVNVWATWCAPCREEFPDIVRVYRELEDRGFRLILVSGDFDTQLPAAKAFLTEQGVDFPTFLKEEDDMKFINTLSPEWTGALPATFLYDGSGTLLDFWEGKASYETLTEKVSAVLNEENNSNPEDRG
jgi:thiol-disulfide isomerase/thioredoxin